MRVPPSSMGVKGSTSKLFRVSRVLAASQMMKPRCQVDKVCRFEAGMLLVLSRQRTCGTLAHVDSRPKKEQEPLSSRTLTSGDKSPIPIWVWGQKTFLYRRRLITVCGGRVGMPRSLFHKLSAEVIGMRSAPTAAAWLESLSERYRGDKRSTDGRFGSPIRSRTVRPRTNGDVDDRYLPAHRLSAGNKVEASGGGCFFSRWLHRDARLQISSIAWGEFLAGFEGEDHPYT